MIIMGIDPGYARVGVGVLDYNAGRIRVLEKVCIETSPRMDFPKRLGSIYKQIHEIIEACSPHRMAIEKLFFQRNTTTALDVSQARGVLILAAVNRDIPVHEYTPLQVKMALTGYGKADKNQIKYMLKAMLGRDGVHKLDDVNDALAVAVCHIHMEGRAHLEGSGHMEGKAHLEGSGHLEGRPRLEGSATTALKGRNGNGAYR